MHNKIWMLLVAVFALAPVVGCDKKEEKKEDKDKKDDDDDKGKKKKKKSSDDDDDDKDKKKKKKDDDDDKKDEKKDKAEEGDKKKIGIKACDEYLDKMDKCSEKTKLGADTAKTLKTSADSTRKAWLTAADGPGKTGLEASCKTMIESSAKSYKTVCPGVFDE